jgi:hypothetical protein
VRRELRGRPALTFQELSWPEPDQLTKEKADFFCDCSQLFLEELLRLPDGARSLREMIRQLPQHLNWQTAFLRAFSPQFAHLLDVEKWWDLACVSFTQVDMSDRYNPEDSWIKFEDSLTIPVEVRQSAKELPVPAEVTLQEIIGQWNPQTGAPVLQQTVQGLELLRLKAAPELAQLLDGYLATLQHWLSDTRPDRPAWTAKNHEEQLASLRYFACKELSALDQRRAALRRQKSSAAAPPQAAAPGSPPEFPEVYFSKNRPQQP